MRGSELQQTNLIKASETNFNEGFFCRCYGAHYHGSSVSVTKTHISELLLMVHTCFASGRKSWQKCATQLRVLLLIRKNEEVYFVCTPKKESCQHTQFVLENVTRAVMRLMRVMVMTAIFRAAQEIGEKAVRTRLHFLLFCFACAAL